MLGVGGLAAVVGRQPAIVAAGVAMLALGVAVARAFPEHNFVPIRTRRLHASLGIARRGATRDRTILALVVVTVLVNGAADSFGRIYPLQLSTLGFPDGSSGKLWFTMLGIGGLITGGLSLYAAERRIQTEQGARGSLLLACAAGLVSLGLLGLAPDLTSAAVAVLIASGVAMPLVRTVTTIWVNRRTSSDVRATVHSFLAQAEYVGEILCAGLLAVLAGVVGPPGRSSSLPPCSAPAHSRSCTSGNAARSENGPMPDALGGRGAHAPATVHAAERVHGRADVCTA